MYCLLSHVENGSLSHLCPIEQTSAVRLLASPPVLDAAPAHLYSYIYPPYIPTIIETTTTSVASIPSSIPFFSFLYTSTFPDMNHEAGGRHVFSLSSFLPLCWAFSPKAAPCYISRYHSLLAISPLSPRSIQLPHLFSSSPYPSPLPLNHPIQKPSSQLPQTKPFPARPTQPPPSLPPARHDINTANPFLG